MSETPLHVRLSELALVRVLCRRRGRKQSVCPGVAEVPLDRLGDVASCPLCGQPFQPEGDTHERLREFAAAALRVLEQGVCELEFVLPTKE